MTGALIATQAVALCCAALMGFAIQRGATCMVAALDEVASKRRARRFIALLEASAIVAAGMILVQLAGGVPMQPTAYLVTGWTVAGGVILGLGAFVAGACVFGSIARLGSGDWAYVLVPAGYFLGSLAAVALGMTAMPMRTSSHSPLLAQAALLAGPFLLLAGWRVWRSVEAGRNGEFAAYVWSPHVATGVIGLTFVILLLSVGSWAYTEVLAEAARGSFMDLGIRLALLVALFGGGIVGGWTAGKLKRVAPTAASVGRCLAGGAMMGLGGSLVPGSNDGLILLGFPLLQPHAWVALASMAAAITLALLVKQRARAMVTQAELA